jgi:hypothetical protein
MAVRTGIVGVASFVGVAAVVSGCGWFGQGDDKGGGEPKPKPAASGLSDGHAAADESKAKAPGRFGDRLFLVGQTAELSGLNLTVEEVKECHYDKKSTQDALERSDKKLVGARVVFESTGEQKVNASREFRAYDSDRVVFRTASLSQSDCTPRLTHTRLDTGEKSKGWIGFKVPDDVEGLTLRYDHRPPKQRGAKGTPAKQLPEFSLSP